MLSTETRTKIGNRPVAYRAEDVVAWLSEQTGVDWAFLLGRLPDVVLRHRWNDLAEKHGLPYRAKSMANMDSLGIGPRRFM